MKHKRANARPRAQGTVLMGGQEPNDLWCTDFKGEFMMADRSYCYPLTVTDYHSRFLLCCEGLQSTRELTALSVYEHLFREYGLPKRIRSDNGVPFASSHALHGLSKLAVWWLRLGIEIERIKPGNPQQNGRHERMHRVLKQETTRPPAINMLQQQDKFEHFMRVYNYERPHEGIEMKIPGDLYRPSSRQYTGLPELAYPFHDRTLVITECGRICMDRKKIMLSSVLAGQKVGVMQVEDQIWQVSFMDYDLGYFDMDSCRLEPGPNPFGPRVLTM